MDIKMSKRGEEKCRHISEVALQMFCEKGYKATSLQDIIKQTGGSLSTIYKKYKNKREFFYQVISDKTSEFFHELSVKLNSLKCKDFEDYLYQFGVLYLNSLMKPESIKIASLLYERGDNVSLIMARNFRTKVWKLLYECLKDDCKKQNFKIHNEEVITRLFIAMLVEPEFFDSVILLENKHFTQKQIEEKVKLIVDIFLHGITIKENK